MKYVTIVSGGMDSVTLAYDINADDSEQLLVSFDYGQRHVRELQAAADAASALSVRWEVIDLRDVGRALSGSRSALLDRYVDVPHGHYAAESMRSTIVPNRNMMMLAIAAAIASAEGAQLVAFAAHGGDHHVYPDCRPEFVEALDRAVDLGTLDEDTDSSVRLIAPYIEWSKTDIARRGKSLGVPFERTWSCYEGGRLHCGKCGTCVERIEALRDAGVDDKTEYAP